MSLRCVLNMKPGDTFINHSQDVVFEFVSSRIENPKLPMFPTNLLITVSYHRGRCISYYWAEQVKPVRIIKAKK